MYRVIKMFDDLMDTVTVKGGKVPYRYEVGDTYPRPGSKPSLGRIAELAGNANLQGEPLIEPITAPPVASVQARVEASEDKVEEVPKKPVRKPRKRRKADDSKD